MYFFPNLKKYFFLIILLYQNNINIISASTTDFEMDRVCADANFDKYKHKKLRITFDFTTTNIFLSGITLLIIFAFYQTGRKLLINSRYHKD